MRNAGLGSWPERRSRIGSERDAVRFEGVTTSHGAFADRVRRLASALSRLGVGAEDRVATSSANHPSALETLFACGQLGAIWVPVNARLSAPETAYILGHSGARVVILGRERLQLAQTLAPGLPDVTAWIGVEPEEGRQELPATCLPYEALLATAGPDPRDEAVTLEDPCLIMYTSGTTGRPKGAVLTHGNMVWNAMNQMLGLDLSADERTLAVGPLFHIGGLNGTVNPTFLRGGCVVVTRRFDPAATLALLETERITSFFAVPTMLDALAAQHDFASRDLSSLRSINAAGAPVPLPTLRRWLARGVTMQQAYGMTEAAPGCTVLDAADAERKVGSAGKPVFFTDVKVVTSDGTTAVSGEVGEVAVCGPNVMAGYWDDPGASAAALRDGWYFTGDAGSVDDEGFLWIHDRFKDMIISGGENIYPAEVESALLEIDGVLEAAVIGVPDEKWGEVGLALLVATDEVTRDGEAIRTLLRERLAGFKIPRDVAFVDDLPKTATGKIRKPDLRERLTSPPHTPEATR